MPRKRSPAFKVVDKETRRGTNLALWKRRSDKKDIEYLLKLYADFFPAYLKDTIVQKLPRTKGLFFFKDIYYAKRLIRRCHLPEDSLMIIKVQPIGKITQPKKILSGIGSYAYALPAYYQGMTLMDEVAPPKGTYVCNSLKVLE